MDPTGPLAQRFPLIARPRPPCTALSARIAALTDLAGRAAHDGDIAAASRVHNQAALIASDCNRPDLARAWCHRHAQAYLAAEPRDARTARLALEPLVNLARLHIRAGDGETALALLEDLYQGVLTRTDTTIDNIPVPTATFTRALDDHHELTQWLWGVHLADGARALTSTGRWCDAEAHLRRHRGIGRRMLDGRQVAIIARATIGDHDEALRLITETEFGAPWEAAVTECLAALIRSSSQPLRDSEQLALAERHFASAPDPALVVFRTRLGLSMIDAITDSEGPAACRISHDLVETVSRLRDGYSARDLLTNATRLAASTPRQIHELASIVGQSGLDQPMPSATAVALEAALAVSETIIKTAIRSPGEGATIR